MSSRPDETKESSHEPGWLGDTNAADIGRQDALMVHAYWQFLRSQTPKMPTALADELTATYVQTRLAAGPEDD